MKKAIFPALALIVGIAIGVSSTVHFMAKSLPNQSLGLQYAYRYGCVMSGTKRLPECDKEAKGYRHSLVMYLNSMGMSPDY